MARSVVDAPAKDKTTIVTSCLLLERVKTHVARNRDNQTDFITRALVNQLEREGDISIRSELEAEEQW